MNGNTSQKWGNSYQERRQILEILNFKETNFSAPSVTLARVSFEVLCYGGPCYKTLNHLTLYNKYSLSEKRFLNITVFRKHFFIHYLFQVSITPLTKKTEANPSHSILWQGICSGGDSKCWSAPGGLFLNYKGASSICGGGTIQENFGTCLIPNQGKAIFPYCTNKVCNYLLSVST